MSQEGNNRPNTTQPTSIDTVPVPLLYDNNDPEQDANRRALRRANNIDVLTAQRGSSARQPSNSSRTMTITESNTNDYLVGYLRATGARTPQIHWDPSVQDNEHAGKKKSNKCCIFTPKQGGCPHHHGKDHPGFNDYERP